LIALTEAQRPGAGPVGTSPKGEFGAKIPRAKAADFDCLARVYRWLEYLTFGPMLSRCRQHYLGRLGHARRALVLGDGDGRSVARFLRSNPHVNVDVVDSSAAMLRQVSRRIAGSRRRVTFHRCDALDFDPSASFAADSSATDAVAPTDETPARYDLVVTHFFLDCFSTAELEILVQRIGPYLAPNALWLVSEFAVPPSQPAAWLGRLLARIVVGCLYRAFGLLTGLRIRKLPAYEGILESARFKLLERHFSLGGLLKTELWTLDRPADYSAAIGV
jgi:hypothetical protein